ncbi:MAG TPA: homocysteine S-methyltransferase [Microbacterium sp.]|nr:homocysteine S-methyltransferase [Microbacterium sp.]
MTTFTDALAAGPIVLDGGLGTLLEQRGHDLSSSLWSARLLLEAPEEIRRAHAEYFAAGARVAITSSYQVSYEALAAEGQSSADVDALLALSVRLAREAVDQAGLGPGEAWVAASIGPYGASLADGSEYTGAYGLDVEQLRRWHGPRIRALADAGPDVIAVETVPSLVELEAVCRELEGVGLPAWLSVTVADGSLRSGDAIEDAAAIAAGTREVVAAGVNCCDVAEVGGALAVLREGTGRPGVAYPNSGERWNADTRRWSGEASHISQLAAQWVADGAGLVGGCCRVGPDQIAEVARAVAASRAR